MNDIELRQAIIDELEFEPSVDAANIGVAVDKGIVSLSGHVASYVEKVAAEKAAKRVKGVRAIAEAIKVRFASDKKTNDDEIARRALNILEWSAVAPKDAVMVKVQDGWVTLSGEVNWQYQRIEIEQIIRRLSGIHGVLNAIALKPHVEPNDVRNRIEGALRRHAYVQAERIHVGVEDGRSVTLDGSVQDLQQREAVKRAAWSVPGVSRVIDRLEVGT